jgi:hypothetical protein
VGLAPLEIRYDREVNERVEIRQHDEAPTHHETQRR